MVQITHQEFTIDSMPDKIFRVAKISPVDLMAITTMVDFEKFESNKTLITFCLENTEVKVGESWQPVKVKGRENYQPMGIDNNFIALNDIFMWMVENVISKTFTKSSESTDQTR